jgi:leucyl/phenylalanyl-tRNA--protein transferase
MFATKSNASKFAFHHLINFAIDNQFVFIDSQVINSFTQSLSAFEVPRGDFHALLGEAFEKDTLQGTWGWEL